MPLIIREAGDSLLGDVILAVQILRGLRMSGGVQPSGFKIEQVIVSRDEVGRAHIDALSHALEKEHVRRRLMVGT